MTAGGPDISFEGHRTMAAGSDAPGVHAAIEPGDLRGAPPIECQLNIRGSTGCGAPYLRQRDE